ncbi:MAG: amino acid racemase [Wenzhouxiangellaceae bacterium]
MNNRPTPLKTIGILGGSSNVATAEYYRLLNDIVNQRLGGWEIAETLIAGMNFGNIEHWLRADDWDSMQAYMAEKVDDLIAGGAAVILGVSNTLHRALVPIMRERTATSEVRFIHIADPTGEAIRQAGLKRIALFGTGPVMRERYIRDHYADQHGLDIIVPSEAEQHDIDRIIFDELCRHQIRPESKARYLEIADRIQDEEGVEGLILGCTEIFLLIDQPDRPHLPMFNTTQLHCEAAVRFAMGLDSD